MTLSVSVAMCTRNGAAYVEEQLDSILRQSHPIAQLVVSDDASTDGTPAVVSRVVENRAPGLAVTLLMNDPPLGVAGNFEQAIQACTSELVALSDQDDVWPADRLARIVAEFEADPNLLLAHGDARLVDDSGEPIGSTLFATLRVSEAERRRLTTGRAFDAYLRRNLVTGATTVLRRSLGDTALPVPPGWIHDEWLGVVAAALGGVTLVPGLLTDYRQHAANEIGVRELGLGGRFRKLQEARSDRNQRLAVRAESLAERLAELEGRVSPRTIALARAKAAHERTRSALPARRVRRIPRVLGSLLHGDYRRFGLGLPDALRDLVQPV